MKKLTFIFTLLFGHTLCFSQTSAKKNVTGKYIGFDKCAFSSFTLSIYKDNKFESNYTGHYFTDKVDKGKWNINGDTLMLRLKKENWRKFIIFDNKLCKIKEDTAFCKFCLIKQ